MFSVSWTQLISEWFLGISSAWVKAIWTMLKYHEWPVISKNTRSHTIFSSNSRKNFSVMLLSIPHVDLTTKKSCSLWINAWFRILFTWFFFSLFFYLDKPGYISFKYLFFLWSFIEQLSLVPLLIFCNCTYLAISFSSCSGYDIYQSIFFLINKN